MTIRTILTCLLNEASAPLLSEASATLAAQYDAHLVGQHTFEAILVYPGVAMHIPGPTYAAFNDAQTAQSRAIEAVFREVTRKADVKSEWRAIDAGSALASDRMIESARTVDLVVMTRPDRDYDRPDQRFALDQVIRDGGRPVLLVPDNGLAPTFGKIALIAHAGTRESARAAFDLLPLLQEKADVHVVHIGDEKDELRDGAMTELSASISRYGHNVTMSHRTRHGKSIADTLLAAATEVGADVIAAGAYGHSRTYAFFLGDTTGSLIRHTKIPVLFSG
ncbi:universal stress protein [Jannaschia aquimarina]|uniref:Universal stress protein family protein n=1 Tax=Jannaschia aquimarina TaxID=935700 RepID=A0A0D1CI42_9RHOB|nr:universal stress protein [Jannaschia aquimarina]KIT14317.1 Universal stress protein family protein [Jannaschia aquimarina]SNS85937.1 Universal stress protein family protein [Jannaschia aquimarina]